MLDGSPVGNCVGVFISDGSIVGRLGKFGKTLSAGVVPSDGLTGAAYIATIEGSGVFIPGFG